MKNPYESEIDHFREQFLLRFPDWEHGLAVDWTPGEPGALTATMSKVVRGQLRKCGFHHDGIEIGVWFHDWNGYVLHNEFRVAIDWIQGILDEQLITRTWYSRSGNARCSQLINQSTGRILYRANMLLKSPVAPGLTCRTHSWNGTYDTEE
ncbi:MAG: hypothetical protein RLN60_03020 [Phycisphaerales bacterium]